MKSERKITDSIDQIIPFMGNLIKEYLQLLILSVKTYPTDEQLWSFDREQNIFQNIQLQSELDF